jgi:D-alanyl-D-alanine carboxypeptidase
MSNREQSLQNILDKTVDQKNIFGTVFAIKKSDFTWIGASGDISIDQPYFIASTTKLFTTSIILKLRFDGKLNLDDKLSKYFDDSVLDGLHVFKGVEYSKEITIQNLLAHTSGLADYFQGKGQNDISLEQELIHGKDQFWDFEKSINRTKTIPPLFAPNTKNKANYSDTNFQILGKIIEIITAKSYSQICDEFIIKPLGLSNTYLYTNSNDIRPKNLYYKSQKLDIPKAMTSFGADGGIVSTASDMLVFIEAFFAGKLFQIQYLDEIQVWNKIFFPMQSGVGLHLFRLPWFFNPFGAIPDFIGHSGLSGALAYYCPKERLFISGTVNQVAHPEISFRTMIKIMQSLKNS